MNATTLGILTAAALALCAMSAQAFNEVWLEDLDLSVMGQQYGRPQKAKSVEQKPLTLGGTKYSRGVGSHANSHCYIDLKGAVVRFEATVGVDDEVGKRGSVVFEVWTDDVLAFASGVMRGGDQPARVVIDCSGAKYLALITLDGGDGIAYDHADWAVAKFALKPGAEGRPVTLHFQDEPAPQIARSDPARPAIHYPRVVGASPNKPFLFRVPATGEPPLRFFARELPPGLDIDRDTGVISGAIAHPGATISELAVSNRHGTARSELTFIAGRHKLAMTPPMGWNSWYVHGVMVEEQHIRDAADQLIKTGLAAHGYQYVCIDDCWADGREEDGTIKIIPKKFADMKDLGDYIHAHGLKFGIYTSPGPKTCAGYEGSYQHELQDAKTFAAWGVDFLKHDWCSYETIAKDHSLAELQAPYRLMFNALSEQDRDMVYSLCQYGLGEVWKWGAKVGGNLWRTTGDIGGGWSSNWESVSGIGFFHNGLEAYAGPGHWNDPDMLMIRAPGEGSEATDMELTRNEQIAHFTLWSLIAAPLILSCDMSQLDQDTLDILTNDEVIGVNQDPLGRAAGR
ncbi:MAG TPA: alpha-galactosidase, partial [Candidatus Hydrogenedentes bacterium]|nr:alpha-galactosidase [Candidatus Hydrogenedentota bacterium]